jgi:hypothetical protein
LEADKSYWDVEDHTYLTSQLRRKGIPIRFVKSYPDHRVYEFAGLQLHVYRSLNALKKYRRPECATILENYSLLKNRRGLWIVLYGAGTVPSTTWGKNAIFSVNRDVHVTSPDTSVRGFIRAVGLLAHSVWRMGWPTSATYIKEDVTG